jgi:(p)ppGpp synthase/HD superfamily hydrolase
MATSNSIDRALAVTTARFEGLVDEDNQPYILHCLRVMLNFADPILQQIGLMHDLLEDTCTSVAELRDLGFDQPVIEALELLTRRPQLSYTDYIVPNNLARQVKLADLRDNSALFRALYRADRTRHDLLQNGRYLVSYQFLEGRIDEVHYRKLMSELE